MGFLWGLNVVFLLASISSVAAEENTAASKNYEDPLAVDEVVITGTRTEKTLLEVPVRTEVVTREEIERKHARDLKEALEDVPGLLIRQTHGKQGESVWMQGFDADRVLILLNGERLPASTGSTVDLTQISAADIERIEIVKGATSALYGSEAMGGVINVITRKPQKPFRLNIQMDSGSFGNKNLDSAGFGGEMGAAHLMLSMALKRPRWNFQWASDLRRSEGFDLGGLESRTEGDSGRRWNIDPRLTLTPSGGGELYVSPRFFKEKKDRQFSIQVPGIGESRRTFKEEAEKWHLTIGGKWPFPGGSRLSGALVYEDFKDVSIQDILDSPQVDQQRKGEIKHNQAEFQWDLPVGEGHLFTMGVLAGYERLSQEQVRFGASTTTVIQEIKPDAKRTHYEGYFQDDIFLTPHLELLPGFRYQNDSDFGGFAAPKINIMVTPVPSVNIRLGYGKGYRVPNLKERFFFFDHSALGYQVIGNPGLQPEESDSFQAGLEYWPGKVFRGEVNIFYNRIKALITPRLNPEKSQQSGLQIFDYQNVDRAITQGVEVSFRYAPRPFLSFKTGYTYLSAKNKVLNRELTERPRHQVKGEVLISIDQLGATLSLGGVYQSRVFVDAQNTVTSPAWTVWDLKWNQELTPKITAFAGIDNFTNLHRNPDRSGIDDLRPSNPRFIYGGIRLAY